MRKFVCVLSSIVFMTDCLKNPIQYIQVQLISKQIQVLVLKKFYDLYKHIYSYTWYKNFIKGLDSQNNRSSLTEEILQLVQAHLLILIINELDSLNNRSSCTEEILQFEQAHLLILVINELDSQNNRSSCTEEILQRVQLHVQAHLLVIYN